jgi:hypothetical protein
MNTIHKTKHNALLSLSVDMDSRPKWSEKRKNGTRRYKWWQIKKKFTKQQCDEIVEKFNAWAVGTKMKAQSVRMWSAMCKKPTPNSSWTVVLHIKP